MNYLESPIPPCWAQVLLGRCKCNLQPANSNQCLLPKLRVGGGTFLIWTAVWGDGQHFSPMAVAPQHQHGSGSIFSAQTLPTGDVPSCPTSFVPFPGPVVHQRHRSRDDLAQEHTHSISLRSSFTFYFFSERADYDHKRE